MNPQDPNGSLPPPQPIEGQPPIAPPLPPVAPVINVPGQQPFVAPPPPVVAPTEQIPIDTSPYDFIVNPPKPAKTIVPLVGGSMVKRAVIAVAGLTILVIIGSIVASLISKGGSDSAPLVDVLQEQTELIRVAGLGAGNATNETTQALTYNVQLTVTSANQQLATYMTDNNTKVNQKLLGLKRDSQVDTQLQNAQGNNTYDATLTSVLQNDLASYSQALKTAYQANPGPKGRKLLSDEFNGANLLIMQSQQNQASATNP